MSMKLVDVNKVYTSGEIKTVALKDVNLEIQDGEFIVILGASGSGKSTMLNVISGLDTPTSGEIYYNKEKISGYNEDELTKFRRANLGFIFQQYNLLNNLTVKENIEIGSSISDTPLDIDEVLSTVGMLEEKNKYPYELSGGQQQRVSIARSVAKNPKIMFCDEPTGALDEATGKQVLQMIQGLNEKYKTTIVMITHNPSIAFMADRVIKMNSGKITDITVNNEKRKVSEIKWG